MTEFLEAVAQTLRNFGFEDARSDGSCVTLRGIRFEVWEHRRSFQFCGRTYRSGNVKQAVLDLIQQLPELLVRLEKRLEACRRDMRLNSINKSLEGHALTIRHYGTSYQLIYTADLDRLESVAKQIAVAEDIVMAPMDQLLASKFATFTSEGGFSLN